MFYLALSLALLNSLGKKRILGGEDATAAPSIVALVHFDTGTVYKDFFCAGSIINESWVLTAANCVFWMDPSWFYIIAGVIDLDDTSGGQTRSIKKIKLHGKYNNHPPNPADEYLNDIALLKLQSPLELNNDVAVIDLANEGDPEEVGQEYTVQGWGETGEYGGPPILQVLDGVPHYRKKSCRKLFLDYFTVSWKKHICAGGERGFGPCVFDWGGPLWMMVNSRPLLYGIWIGAIDCGTDFPAIYTKVSFYRRWIERKSKLILSNPCTCEEQDSCECYSGRRLTDPDFDVEE